jgi:hypothetical protein
MTEIFQVDLKKSSLSAIPLAERRLLLLLGHAANEINVIQKLILVSGQEKPKIQFVDIVQAGQTFILIRILIGKMHEAWKLFTTRFHGDRLIKEKYEPRLSDEARKALNELGKHFGGESPLSQIRNNFSFHYRDENDLVEKSFHDVPEDDAWHFYLSNMQGNCFYYASELIVIDGVIKLAGRASQSSQSYSEQTQQNLEKLFDLIVSVSGHLLTLFGECIIEICAEHLADAKLNDPVALQAPALESIHIPFFINEDALISKKA